MTYPVLSSTFNTYCYQTPPPPIFKSSKMKSDQVRVQKSIESAIKSMCEIGLLYENEIYIHATISIRVDRKDCFCVLMNETIQKKATGSKVVERDDNDVLEIEPLVDLTGRGTNTRFVPVNSCNSTRKLPAQSSGSEHIAASIVPTMATSLRSFPRPQTVRSPAVGPVPNSPKIVQAHLSNPITVVDDCDVVNINNSARRHVGDVTKIGTSRLFKRPRSQEVVNVEASSSTDCIWSPMPSTAGFSNMIDSSRLITSCSSISDFSLPSSCSLNSLPVTARYSSPIQACSMTIQPAVVSTNVVLASNSDSNCHSFIKMPSIAEYSGSIDNNCHQELPSSRQDCSKTNGYPSSGSNYGWPSPLLAANPAESASKDTAPTVYMDLPDMAENTIDSKCRLDLLIGEMSEKDENNLLTPWKCKFPGCGSAYVECGQLANHYSVTHTESMNLMPVNSQSQEQQLEQQQQYQQQQYQQQHQQQQQQHQEQSMPVLPRQHAVSDGIRSKRLKPDAFLSNNGNMLPDHEINCPYPECQLSFISFIATNNHIQDSHERPQEQEEYQCGVFGCRQQFLSHSSMLVHLRTVHHEMEATSIHQNRRFYRCMFLGDTCQLQCSNWEIMVKHLEQTHQVVGEQVKDYVVILA